MSWAAVVSNRKPPLHKHHGTALEKPMDRVNVQPHLIDQFNEVERRTQVLRKVPPSTTTVSILNDLKVQCEGPLSDVVDAVVQEPLQGVSKKRNPASVLKKKFSLDLVD